MWRLALVFAGIVLMINGCNGLLSGQFGTQKLRTLPLADAVSGVGDADYLEVTGAVLADLPHVTPAKGGAPAQVQWPLVSPEQRALLAAGRPLRVQAVGWVEAGTLPVTELPRDLRGFVSPPRSAGDWSGEGVEVLHPTLYIHLGEAPTSWYWQAAMLLGGLALALGTEALAYRRKKGATTLR